MSRDLLAKKRNFHWDRIFKITATVAGEFFLLIMVLIFGQLLSDSWLIWEIEGLLLVTGDRWNTEEGREAVGALQYIAGT